MQLKPLRDGNLIGIAGVGGPGESAQSNVVVEGGTDRGSELVAAAMVFGCAEQLRSRSAEVGVPSLGTWLLKLVIAAEGPLSGN